MSKSQSLKARFIHVTANVQAAMDRRVDRNLDLCDLPERDPKTTIPMPTGKVTVQPKVRSKIGVWHNPVTETIEKKLTTLSWNTSLDDFNMDMTGIKPLKPTK